MNSFFLGRKTQLGDPVAERLEDRLEQFRIVVLLAHVPDPVGFLEGCRTLTEPDGVTSIEVPYLLDLLEGLAYGEVLPGLEFPPE